MSNDVRARTLLPNAPFFSHARPGWVMRRNRPSPEALACLGVRVPRDNSAQAVLFQRSSSET